MVGLSDNDIAGVAMAHAVLVFESIYVSEPWAAELEEKIKGVLSVLRAELADPPTNRALTPAPSGEPFDGCDTCIRREIMVLTIMATIDAMPDGLVERRLVA